VCTGIGSCCPDPFWSWDCFLQNSPVPHGTSRLARILLLYFLQIHVLALALVCVCSLAEVTSVSLLGIAFFFLRIFGYCTVPCCLG
jgi:hypothetical protein